MSEDLPPPQRIQLHLSTLLLSALIAAALIWGQLREYPLREGSRQLGWPFSVTVTQKGRLEGRATESWIILIGDGVISLGLLVGGTLLTETILLYREPRKP